MICIILILLGEFLKIYWIGVLVIIVIILGLFLAYNLIQQSLDNITEKLKKFIKSNPELKNKMIKVKIGKYGKYILFTVIIPKNQDSDQELLCSK